MPEKSVPFKSQKTLVPCKICGCTVLRLVWNGTLGRWTTFDPVREPLSGDRHDCALALIRYAARWQYLVALRPQRRFQGS